MLKEESKLVIEKITPLQRIVKTIPTKSGVYLMKNKNDQIIYIGKAKNLYARLKSYTLKNLPSLRVEHMVKNIANIEYIVTKSEEQALILENDLVKAHKPKYNILLRDDKSFPYIYINIEHDYPRIQYIKKKNIKGKIYIGPFTNSINVKESIKFLQKYFMLRVCSDISFKNRQKPCIFYQIKFCSAPCVHKITKEDYKQNVDMAIKFLTGKNKIILKELKTNMEIASQKRMYDEAQKLKELILSLLAVQNNDSSNLTGEDNFDFLTMKKSGDIISFTIFVFRNGRNHGEKYFFWKDDMKDLSSLELLNNFIFQLYDVLELPDKILLSKEIEIQSHLQKALQSKFNKKIEIKHIGTKYKTIENQLTINADKNMEHFLQKTSKYDEKLRLVQKILNSTQEIKRIETYDNSHIQGEHALGAMVCYEKNQGFNKNEYRIFNIDKEKINTKDDLAMMEHVLNRRFTQIVKNIENNNDEKNPDVVLIDGGIEQFKIVANILQKHGLQERIKLLSIAKTGGRYAKTETIFTHENKISLDTSDSTLHFLQELRDEAHRFAITSYRKKHIKNLQKSNIKSIQGLGEKRYKNLLEHFGTIEKLSTAEEKEIKKAKGITEKLAKNIFNYFH